MAPWHVTFPESEGRRPECGAKSTRTCRELQHVTCPKCLKLSEHRGRPRQYDSHVRVWRTRETMKRILATMTFRQAARRWFWR